MSRSSDGAGLKILSNFLWKCPFKAHKIRCDAGYLGNTVPRCTLVARAGDFIVVEENDNPSIYTGEEDRKNRDIYERIIDYLTKR